MSDDQPASSAIRTPDHRLRVFVSSTLAELAAERAVVARSISALRLTPVLFELGAKPHPPQEVYRAYLAQSDIFIGLYWQRYGWVGPGMEVSGLEDELLLSRSLPRLLYVKAPAPDRDAGLAALIDRFQSEATDSYRTFRTPRELGRLVRDDLAVLLSERFTIAARAAAPTPRAPSAPSALPAPVAGDRRPRRPLPVATTSLIGRERDIEEASRLLEQPDVRLVTLTGPGGIGKTRLAVAVCERLADRYPPGPVFVPLGSITDPGLMLPQVAAAMGAALDGGRSPQEALVEQLGETPALLVLDNLEHVMSAVPELDELLVRCPGLTVLATSRIVLRLRAEREYPVAPLAVPSLSSRPSFAALAALPAVELFVDRAQAVRRDFALTEANAVAVAEICRRLDGLPLAIELAAARIRILAPADLLARLEHRLDALGTGPVDLPERQRTLRATIEWSVGLLSDAEREMLATLAIFVDGWTIEAAMRVTGLSEPDTLELLDALARHSLVNVTATEAGPRFRMLEAVREHAAELLAAGSDYVEIARRHAEYFREFAVDPDGTAPVYGRPEWAERLQAEDGNLRAAIRWFLAHDITPLPQLFQVLWVYWEMQEQLPGNRVWVDALLPRAASFDLRGQAELALTAATTAIELGDYDAARVAGEQLARLEGHIGDPYLEGHAPLVRAWIVAIDDLEDALRLAALSLDRLRRLDAPFMTASAANTVGMAERELGRLDDARRHLREAGELARRFGFHWVASAARAQLADLAVETGQLDEARELLDSSLGATGYADFHAITLSFWLVASARLAMVDGDPQRAALALGAADGLRCRAGLRAWPTQLRGEAELLSRVEQALDPTRFEQAFAAGSQLNRREAVAVVRGDVPAPPA